MTLAFRLAAVVLVLAAGAACGGGDSASDPAQTASSESQFGAPECDAYIAKYMACVDRMPEAARASARQSLEQTRATWQQTAGTPQGKAALAAACKAASDVAAASMQAYGCNW